LYVLVNTFSSDGLSGQKANDDRFRYFGGVMIMMIPAIFTEILPNLFDKLRHFSRKLRAFARKLLNFL